MTPLLVSLCPSCEWRGFPERLWCPRCGCQELAAQSAGRAAVTEETFVTRAVGHDLGPGVWVATVALELGGTVVVRLESAGATSGKVCEDLSSPVLVSE